MADVTYHPQLLTRRAVAFELARGDSRRYNTVRYKDGQQFKFLAGVTYSFNLFNFLCFLWLWQYIRTTPCRLPSYMMSNQSNAATSALLRAILCADALPTILQLLAVTPPQELWSLLRGLHSVAHLPRANYLRVILERIEHILSSVDGGGDTETTNDDCGEACAGILGRALRNGGDHGYFTLHVRRINNPSHSETSVCIWQSAFFSDISARVWPAASALVAAVVAIAADQSLNILVHRRRLVELGAGTGVAGLAIAAAGVGAADALLTDGDSDAVARLAAAVQLNASVLTCPVRVSALEWGRDCPKADETPHLVVGSDLLYDPLDMPALATTLHGLLANSERSPPFKCVDTAEPRGALHWAMSHPRVALIANTIRNDETFLAFTAALHAKHLVHTDVTEIVSGLIATTGGPATDATIAAQDNADVMAGTRLSLIISDDPAGHRYERILS